MFKIKVRAELVPSEGCVGRLCSRPLSRAVLSLCLFVWLSLHMCLCPDFSI